MGRYRLVSRLGTGGMGRVFLGQSPSGRYVAVKVIRPELADDPGFRRRFAQEVSAARRVSGIFTAPVVDADPDGPQPWLVTAHVAGPSLADAVERQGPMPVESVLTLAAGLAEGLGAVHAAGLVHRDLKPSNVLLASDGPRIIDFGISRAADSTWLTNAGGVVGSPGFMSPEQAEGRQVGPPADIFSLGGVLAYAATGEPPFGGGSASALLYRVVYGTAATDHVPAQLRPLVERCLAKDPAARPTTDELLADLGFAEPDTDWLSWHAAAPWSAAALPETELDEPLPAAASDALAGNVAASAAPGSPARGTNGVSRTRRLGSPAGRHGRARPRRPRRRGSGILIGCAVAGVLAAGAALGIAIAVASHHNQERTDASMPPAAGSQHQSTTQASPPLLTGVAPGPRAVVDSYFAAINRRDWRKVWRLGGKNLSQSYDEMIDGYTQTARDVIRSVAVTGDHAFVRVRALETNGALQVYDMDYLIQDGEIVHASQTLLATQSPGG